MIHFHKRERSKKVTDSIGAESFLKRQQSLSYSRIFQLLLKFEVSVSCTQEPATDPYPKPYGIYNLTGIIMKKN
jgi:hypothetical protein